MQAMDTSHVALVSLFLSFEGFETYNCKQTYVIGINIANFCKVLKLADPNDSICLMLNDGNTESLVI